MIWVIFAVCLFPFITLSTAGPPYVNIPGIGSLQGIISTHYEDVAVFYGIPYAKPPVGKLRWQVPQAHGPWTDKPLHATKFGDRCMQAVGTSHLVMPMSEDCLFLNIAAPIAALNSSQKLPVMFWIYGGAYIRGQTNIYPLDSIVASSKSSVIVVTVNYRLNVFGFLGSAEIQKHTTDGSAGNFGIQDQRLAMSWVRDHISIFGGNGADITIFGESAGGNSVINHLAQPTSFPFFGKAIIQSGTYSPGAVPLNTAQKSYNATLKTLNCKDLDCLLSIDANTLYTNGSSAMGYNGPVIDGVSLSATPTDLIAQGKYKKVPVMIGSNRDERALWAIQEKLSPTLTESEFDTWFKTHHPGSDLVEYKQLYDPSVYPYPKKLGNWSQWWWTSVRVDTDEAPWGLGPCGVRSLSRSLLKGGTPVLYAYLYAHPNQVAHPGIPGIGPGSVTVPHESERLYVFPSKKWLNPGEEVQLATAICAYWCTFAKTGVPNPKNLPEWPKYVIESDTILRLELPSEGGIRAQQALRKVVCDYNDAHKIHNVALYTL